MKRLAAGVLCALMTLSFAACDKIDFYKPEPTDPDMSGVPVTTVNDIIVVGDTAYEPYYFRQETADKYAAAVNKARQTVPSDCRVFDILVPTAIDVTLAKSVRDTVSSDSQLEGINYIYGKVNDTVTKVEVYDTLRYHRDEYIYFRTDHHYTARGAWYAYLQYCEAAGIKAADLDSDFTVSMFQNYHGSFYRKTNNYKTLTTPDYVVAYVPKDTNDIKITQKNKKKLDWSIVRDASKWDNTNLYNCFIGGDQPFAVITNNAVKNDSSCLVIKESYGNPFVPYLVPNYNKIYVVDYRYYSSVSKKKLAEVVKENNIKDVIFINNMSMTRNPSLVSDLSKFVG